MIMASNYWNHFKTICKHKRWVAHYCFMSGLRLQGIFHDMSKFSPTEFIESARYYQGNRSPIDACKEEKGYSLAWFHHRGRNKHHWEYWVDDFSKGMVPKKMPFKYVLEMICDYLGAGRVYMGKNFSMEKEYEWWLGRRKEVVMHRDTLKLVDEVFQYMLVMSIEEVLGNKTYIKWFEDGYKRGEIVSDAS